MERADRISDKPDHWHRASQLWLQAEKAPPPDKRWPARPDPEDAWPAPLSNAHRMPDDIPAAAAAKEAHLPASIRPRVIVLKS